LRQQPVIKLRTPWQHRHHRRNRAVTASISTGPRTLSAGSSANFVAGTATFSPHPDRVPGTLYTLTYSGDALNSSTRPRSTLPAQSALVISSVHATYGRSSRCTHRGSEPRPQLHGRQRFRTGCTLNGATLKSATPVRASSPHQGNDSTTRASSRRPRRDLASSRSARRSSDVREQQCGLTGAAATRLSCWCGS